ncbi:MAG: hypothetical protein WC575_03935 [Patescibacteria group bacterium]
MNKESQFEKELSLEEKLERAKAFLEKARVSSGQNRTNAVFEVEGYFIDADLTPEDLQKIGTSREELDELILQGDKEEAKELLERARSSHGQERFIAVTHFQEILESQAAKRKGIKSFGLEEIGTTPGELNALLSEYK